MKKYTSDCFHEVPVWDVSMSKGAGWKFGLQTDALDKSLT